VRWKVKWSFDGQLSQEYPYKNYYNLIILLQVTVEKVWDVFATQCRFWREYSRPDWLSNDFKLPPHRMSVSALPAESGISEILHFYSMEYDYLIKITHIFFCFWNDC